MNKNDQAGVEAIVIKIGEETLVLPVDAAKQLHKALDKLFGEEKKEYIPWPIVQPIKYDPPQWDPNRWWISSPSTGSADPFPIMQYSSNTLTISGAIAPDVTASYTIQGRWK